MKVTGHIKATVIKPDGSKIVHCDQKNTITSVWLQHIIDQMEISGDTALNNLFDGNATPPPNGEDGIVIRDSVGAVWYEMDCDGGDSQPTPTSYLLSATFTGTAITISGPTQVRLGYSWFGTPVHIFTLTIANPTAWASLVLSAADVLQVDWTLTFA